MLYKHLLKINVQQFKHLNHIRVHRGDKNLVQKVKKSS